MAGAILADGIPAGFRVLLVEDDTALSEIARELLAEIGCNVVHAAYSAEAAIDWMGAGGEADLILTDIIMPGMNGVALAVHVSERNPALPVLLATGYGEALLDEQQRHYPVVAKPYRTEDMRAAIGGAILLARA